MNWTERYPDDTEPVESQAAYLVRTLADDPAMREALRERCPEPKFCFTPSKCAGKDRCERIPVCNE